MKKRGKKYSEALAKVEKGKLYTKEDDYIYISTDYDSPDENAFISNDVLEKDNTYYIFVKYYKRFNNLAKIAFALNANWMNSSLEVALLTSIASLLKKDFILQ